jgi:SAM-dependent methyltransferase
VQRRAYLDYHAARNAANAVRSRELGIETRPLPIGRVHVPGPVSPARWAVSQFFDLAASLLRPNFIGRAITILDLGCGKGEAALPCFAAHGYRGRYIGLDLAKHPKWTTNAPSGFTKELVLADVHEIDVQKLPPIDLLVSATCLEHIREDGVVLSRFAERLSPAAAQAHFVPGEGALPLYTTHGWRQYSPACLRERFPTGEIHRAGGHASSWLHHRSSPRRARAVRCMSGGRGCTGRRCAPRWRSTRCAGTPPRRCTA